MAFPALDSPVTGTAVPLSALRSRLSLGMGEFPDLVPLGRWCQSAGLSLIQLLPLNDTGFEPSPYSALSAFALHPVYLRLSDLPGYETIRVRAEAAAKELPAHRVDHQAVWLAKLALLKVLFAAAQADAEIASWARERPWAEAYAVFWALRERYGRAGWQNWPANRAVTKVEIHALFESMGREALFPLWLQVYAERQLLHAVQELETLGVALKGDLPILLNEDSADVWAHPEFFDLNLRAGAPPDGMNPDGQNWGFPVYRWDQLARDGYSWWKERLRHAARFYQAYRIDHVLGFFRIWATPRENGSAQLGLYQPGPRVTTRQLRELGFDDGRQVWMSEPHVFGWELRDRLGDEASIAENSVLIKVGAEDLYRFRPAVTGERVLWDLSLSERSRWQLVSWYRNRALLNLGGDVFSPTAQYYATRAYASLNEAEKNAFERLIRHAHEEAELLWEQQGRTLLEFMKTTTPMLVCAEDLGSIPDCVPRVLADLKILGLKIVRWARDWNTAGQPYYRLRDYPELSVCTPSVHDTSTLRQWWDEERDHRPILVALGLDPERDDGPFTPGQAQKIVGAHLTTSARLCILPLQDWFSLDADLRTDDPAAERINVPGTVGPENWAWRMKPFLEDLDAHHEWTESIRRLTDSRRTR